MHCRYFINQAARDLERLGGVLQYRKILRFFKSAFHRELVCLLVRLRSRRVNRRPFCLIQHAELDCRLVNDETHLSAEGVNLANHLPLGKTADCRIAGHLGNVIIVDRQQQRARPQTRGGQSRFHAGVSGPDHNDVPIQVRQSVFLSSPRRPALCEPAAAAGERRDVRLLGIAPQAR